LKGKKEAEGSCSVKFKGPGEKTNNNPGTKKEERVVWGVRKN